MRSSRFFPRCFELIEQGSAQLAPGRGFLGLERGCGRIAVLLRQCHHLVLLIRLSLAQCLHAVYRIFRSGATHTLQQIGIGTVVVFSRIAQVFHRLLVCGVQHNIAHSLPRLQPLGIQLLQLRDRGLAGGQVIIKVRLCADQAPVAAHQSQHKQHRRRGSTENQARAKSHKDICVRQAHGHHQKNPLWRG